MIKFLFRNLGEYKKTAYIAPVFVLLETITGLILPILMANIVDIGVTQNNQQYIIIQGVLMVTVTIVGTVAGLIGTRICTNAAQGLGSNLRVSLFRHMQSFSFADIDKFSTASLITRTTNDVTALQMSFQMGLRTLVSAPFQLIVALVIVFGINVKLALIYMCAIPVLFIFVSIITRSVRPLFSIMQEKLDELNATIQENLVAIRVVKSFVRENHEREKFKKANDNVTHAGLNALFKQIMMMPGSMFIIHAVTIVILWVGGHMVGNGELLSGELIATNSYLMQIMMSIMMFSMILMQVTRAQASAERIAEVLSTDPDIKDPSVPNSKKIPESSFGSVEFRDVNFRYSVTGTGENVLKKISFKAEPGETIAIVGDTGSGKSTLVNLIPRFYDVTDGEVLVNGVNVRDYNITDLRDNIGMVLQKNVLFSGSIRENMLWGKEGATDEEIIRALKDAQAYDFVMSFPEGLDTMIAQGGMNVSGGQKQRLCIARAMLKSPHILILDDSTSAVDSYTESRIRESFKENLNNCTVFIIAQRISSVANADKIIVLNEDGEIEAIGKHADLMVSSKIYSEICSSQQEGALADV